MRKRMRKGYAIFSALILVSLVLLFSVILFGVVTMRQTTDRLDWQTQQARYIAEAGITQAIARLGESGLQGKPDENGMSWQASFGGGSFVVHLEYVPYARRTQDKPWRIVSTATFQGRGATQVAHVGGYDPLRKIVRFDKNSTPQSRRDTVSRYGHFVKNLDLISAAVVILDAPDSAGRIPFESRVVGVDNDVLVAISAQTTPWGISRIQAPSAWGTSTASGVKVGIIDTGISTSHPDLTVAGGVNTINPKRGFNDDNGHGSHVAGITAALNNAWGVVGGGHGASLYAVKVLGSNGSGFLSDVIEGIQWCAANGMRVANMSLGTSSDVQSLHDAVLAATNAGLILVAAAGNSSGGPVSFPAAYAEVIAVSASTSGDALASFSSVGPEVDVIAPGASIYSTYKGTGYRTLSGTSMAAPHATAACALRVAIKPAITAAEMRQELQLTADPLPGLTSGQQGAGMVDAMGLVLLP